VHCKWQSIERKVKKKSQINFLSYCKVQQHFFRSTCYPRFPANKDSQLIIQNNHTAVIVQSADTNYVSPKGTKTKIHQRPKSHRARITARHCYTEHTPLLANEPTVNLNSTSVI